MKINNFSFKGLNGPNRIKVDQISPNKTKVSRIDRIFVEQGTHEELLQHGGLYSSMWIQQSSDSPSADSLPGPTEGVSENQASSPV